MNSRFFQSGYSDTSDSESSRTSSDYTSSSEDEQQEQKDQQKQQSVFAKYLADDDSSDEDTGKRVVKSAKQKLHEELEGIIKVINAAKDNSDFVTIQNGKNKRRITNIV
jgi:translation initiation factor 3 subunit C